MMSDNGRFFREAKVFDGEMKIVFRSRSQMETDEIAEQARRDLHGLSAESTISMGDVTARIQRYQLLTSLHSLTNVADGGEKVFKTLDETRESIENDPGTADDPPSALKALEKEIVGSGRSSGLFNVLTAEWMEFERLYAWLTSKAHDSVFWKAAGGAHS